MEYVTYGRTGLEVSNIAFGTWELGGDWGTVDREQAIAAIRRARQEGITFFDTAQAYGFGASEKLLGEALRDDLDHRRHDRLGHAAELPAELVRRGHAVQGLHRGGSVIGDLQEERPPASGHAGQRTDDVVADEPPHVL